MSAFTRALSALHADANLSVACTWAPGWGRDAARALVADLVAGTVSLSIDGTAVRGVRAQPQDAAFGAGGGLGAITPRETLDLAIADLPAVAMRDDLAVIGAESFIVERVERDVEALTWRLTLGEP
jgi:hypothetical protein